MDFSLESLIAGRRTTKLIGCSFGELGPMPATKIGGVPFWPEGEPRPVCSYGHVMAFQAQVRLSDVPEMEGQASHLLSLHYCVECMREGRMSLGLEDREAGPVGGRPGDVCYQVTTVSCAPTTQVDGEGLAGAVGVEACSMDLAEASEVMAMEEFWRPTGVYAGGNYPAAYPIEADDFAELGLPDYSNRDVSKLGGWPSWKNAADWPECPHGRPFEFIAQLSDRELPESAWGGGGFGYLWACSANCPERRADMSCQFS